LQSLCDDTFNQLETTTTTTFVKFDEVVHQHMKAAIDDSLLVTAAVLNTPVQSTRSWTG